MKRDLQLREVPCRVREDRIYRKGKKKKRKKRRADTTRKAEKKVVLRGGKRQAVEGWRSIVGR